MDGRVPPALLEVGKRVTAHLKWAFMPDEQVETGPIQSIQDVGPARIVKVNNLDVFATGLPDSPGWFTDYDPPALPAPPPPPRRRRAVTPPGREPTQLNTTPGRKGKHAAGRQKTNRRTRTGTRRNGARK